MKSGGLITNPNGPTALDKKLSNRDRHEMDDHTGCGSACQWSSLDFRPEPIFDRVMVEEMHKRDIAWYNQCAFQRLPLVQLRSVAARWKVPGYRAMRKADLVATLLSHPKLTTELYNQPN